MQRFLARFPAYAKVSSRVPGFRVFWLMQSPPDPGSMAYQLLQTLPSGSYSLQRLSAILASKDFFTVMASSGHIS